MRIAPQVSLTGLTPDDLKSSSPPGSVLLVGTNALQLTVAVTAGAVTCSPRFWDGASWCPLQGDDALDSFNVVADSAGVAVGCLTEKRAAEPRWWAVLRTGAGTLNYCDIAEAVK